ncbi:glycosyl transferase [Lacticaseibacillus chiayiensis]|uniref:glycosyl transferase n=1 Tax=Lacticaseibacillus chiayiensis TaxID=2100821 RepID=UPI003C727470
MRLQLMVVIRAFLWMREFRRVFTLLRLNKQLRKSEDVFIQYPLPINAIDRFLFRLILKINHSKAFIVIHDLISIQGVKSNKSLKDEIKDFNKASGVITHNESMSRFLVQHGLKTPYKPIDFFDYYSKTVSSRRAISNHIVFAGNLAKSSFLSELPFFEDIEWDIYGEGISRDQLPDFVHFHGPVSSETLPSVLPDGWGLVWDGNKADIVSGKGGKYLTVNSPHKASLYLAAGLPLIVWKESALAKLVESKHLGIAVSSLNDIRYEISRLSEHDISLIEQSVSRYSKLITNGDMIVRALSSIRKIVHG